MSAAPGGLFDDKDLGLIASGGHTLLTDSNRARLQLLDLPRPEHFWFTAKNGKRIHNVVYFPPRLDPARKYPLIVNPHGGPNSMDSDAFSTRWNAPRLWHSASDRKEMPISR